MVSEAEKRLWQTFRDIWRHGNFQTAGAARDFAARESCENSTKEMERIR